MISTVFLLSMFGCESMVVDTESGTRIEVVVNVDGQPASGVHAYLYVASGDCASDDTGGDCLQDAVSTDSDAIFGELEPDTKYYIKVKTGDLTSSCKSITTVADEMVSLNFSF